MDDGLFDSESFLSARDAIVVFDPDTLAIVDSNERARERFGREQGALALADLARSESPYDEPRLRIELGRAIQVGASRFEWRTRTANGDLIWLDAFAKVVRDENTRALVVFAEDVTAEKETHDALWRTTAYLTAALEQSPAAILVVDAPDGRIRLTNGAADALRVPSTDPRFDSVHSIPLRSVDGIPIPDEDRPLARALFEGIATENDRFSVEVRPGRVRIVLVHAAPIRDGKDTIVAAIAVISDITEVVRAENAIRERDMLVRRFYENVSDVMMSVDDHGTIVALSPSAEQVFGYPTSALIDRPMAEVGLLDAESLPRAESDRKRVIAGEVLAPSEYVYRTASGTRRIGEVTGSPVDDGRGHRLALFVIRDVTERRAADEHRAQMETVLRRRQRLEVVGALASGVAHDINNPLTGVLNLAEMLQIGLVAADEVSETGARIVALCDRMGSIVSRLLSLARSETAESELVDLESLVRGSLDLVGLHLRRARIDATVVAEPALPLVRCRAQAIEQAVVNIIGNAIDALGTMPPEHPRALSIGIRTVEIDAERGVRITVRDNGPGVDPSIADTMFEPFVSTKSASLGPGLGLWVSVCVAVEHGGRLHHDPCAERGACFHLDLPSSVDARSKRASPR